jgi:6-phosphogluconolactonase (cycloisomerase 2 family)
VKRLLTLAIIVVTFLLAPMVAQADVVTFTGKAGTTDWNTADNWSPRRVPTQSDDVVIPSGKTVTNKPFTGLGGGIINSLTLGGTLTIDTSGLTLQGASTINNLTLTSSQGQYSTLTMNGNTLFSGNLVLSPGLVMGSGTATIKGPVTISSSGSALDPASVDNQASITITQNNLQVTLGNSSFTNDKTGTIALQGDGITILGSGTFTNSGSIAKSMGSGTSVFSPTGTFSNGNKGTVAAQSGTLQLSVVGTSTGTFNASSGATLKFANVVTLNAGTTFGGAGTMDIIASGVWDVEAPVTVNTTNLAFDAGETTMIKGTSDLTIKSVTVTWNGGAITGAGKLTVTKQVRDMQILTTASHSLEENLDLFGTINLSADLNLGATVTIEPNAKFNILTDNGITGSGVINNGGIFQKVKGRGISNIGYGGTFNIAAPKGARPAVMAKTGTLNFAVSSGGALGGIWTASLNATLEFSGTGNYSLPDGFQFTGGGTTLLTTATWSLASGTGISVDTSRFEFDGMAGAGIIQGSNNLTVNSTNFVWTGGRMQGPGTTTIPAGVTLTIKNSNPPGNKPLVEGRTIENAGTTEIVDKTSLLLGGGAVWHNQAKTGLFEFKSDGKIGDNGGGATFNNDGTVEKVGGLGIHGSSITFSGTFNNNAGAQVITKKGDLFLGPSQGMSAGKFITNDIWSIHFSAGTWAIKQGTEMSGNGEIQLDSEATWNLMANLDVQSNGFVMRGTITGAFDLTLEGNAWLSGARTGGGTIKIPNATSIVNVFSTLTLDKSTLDNSAGRLNIWYQGTVVVQNGAVLMNEKDGKISLGVDKGVNTPAVEVDSGTFSNLGTVTFDTFNNRANPTQTIGGTEPMQNQGTISVPANRSLMLSAGFNDLGGSMTLKGGTILTGDTFNIKGGVVGGIGDFYGTINDEDGILGAGLPIPGPGTGILNLNAPLTQGSGAAIAALISGTTAGTQYDQINSTSSMALNGTLNLKFGNGFTPAPTDKFNILNFSSATGNFSTVNAPTGWTAHLNLTGTALNVQFTKNGVSVSINPKAAMVKANGTTQFTGVVVGASKNGEKWSVKESGGGTVTQMGVYAAPATPGTYHVIVTSVADAAKSDTATVTVTALGADKLTVTPQGAVLQPGAVLRLQANQSVVWSIAEGRVAGSVSAGGTYTAPRQPGLYHVVAADAEGSNHAVANIAVTRGKLESAYVSQPDKNAVSVLADITGDGPTTGLRETESLAAGQGPVALAISPDWKLLVSANRNSNDISLFALSHRENALSILPGTSFAVGAQPSSVAFDPTGRFVFITNTGSDDVSVFSVDASGQLIFLRSYALAAGDKPSAIAVHPDGSVVYVTNAGTNAVQGFAWDAAGMLRPLSGSPSATGNTPSAAIIDSAGKFLFVANRGSGDVSAFAIDVKNKTLQEVEGSPFKTGRGAAAIAIDLTGSYLFAADHQANDIASMQIDSETGVLTLLGRTSLLSAGPSALVVDPSGQYLHVTSDKAGGVTTLKLDVATGTLTPESETTASVKASSIALGSSTATTPGP